MACMREPSPFRSSERVVLHVVDEGAGRPVVLLHGFPDSSALWRHQSRALVDAGFRAIAPDLRGFGRSPRPERVEDYTLTKVVGDVLALMDDLGVEQADVVGHDWGSAVAAIAPERVRRFVAVSVGHPAVRRHLGVEQRERSWYMLLFQFPQAEQLLAADDWKLFRQLLREDGDMDSYLEDLGPRHRRPHRRPELVPSQPCSSAPVDRAASPACGDGAGHRHLEHRRPLPGRRPRATIVEVRLRAVALRAD